MNLALCNAMPTIAAQFETVETKSKAQPIEGFSTGHCNSKTKVILANHNKHTLPNEPIRPEMKCM